jgi:Sulfotransferase domain
MRPEDSWLRSMTQTLIHAHHNPEVPKDTPMRPMSEEYHSRAWKNDFAAHGREAYRSHNDAVRKAAEQDGRPLLEYDVSQGWKPLCELLDVDVPAGDFPRDDAWKEYKARYSQ